MDTENRKFKRFMRKLNDETSISKTHINQQDFSNCLTSMDSQFALRTQIIALYFKIKFKENDDPNLEI